MVRPFKKDINFLSKRRIFFAVSAALLVISILAIVFKGLTYGIEFVGGTSIDFSNTGEITTEQMRDAFTDAGAESPLVQTTMSSDGEAGFVVRTSETDAAVASAMADEVAAALELDTGSFQVMTIGPGWGQEVTRTSAIAFLVALVLIIGYVAVRFEYKMSLAAVLTLIHDLVIIVGIYAVFGREITPNVVAALLTIMGYSLYDTVVVFHRIKDNMESTKNHSFMTVANHSINQVLMRTINTLTTALVPILAMLFFGGETLKDFAFAMAFGLVLGSYSSVFVATPLYALWKQREPRYRKLYEKYGDGVGFFAASENLGE
ncbi:MAG: protein translocase subunit SecF [Coriobacteriales bacterium]|jgi:SecD/SecF fusion protein|nr:protein translocase subunit SecF [Coriobacteriales bacterium]